MPATHTDIDHTIAHATGGRTSHGNLGLLCRHHHLLKHDSGWTLEQPQPGRFIWTTPAGRTYTTDHTTNTEETPPTDQTDDPCPF
jgi:hypothetical protein